MVVESLYDLVFLKLVRQEGSLTAIKVKSLKVFAFLGLKKLIRVR